MRQKIMLVVAVALVGGAGYNVYQRFGPAAEKKAIAQDKADRAARRAAADVKAEEAERAPMAQALLVRELARQSIRIAAERGGLSIADLTLASRATDEKPVDLDATVTDAAGTLKFDITRAGRSVAAIELPAKFGPGDLIPYESIVAGLVERFDADFANAVTLAGGRKPAPLGTAALPAGVDAMLVRPNPFDAFRAARLVHAAVAKDGASPARLSALARAYATLGDSTRPLLSAHSPAAFARALVYAEQLVREQPKDAASYWTRAYVRGMLAVPGARADVEQARKLGGDVPGWATLVAGFVEGDTGSLFAAAAAGGADGALAAHLAMRTVEYSRLDAVAVRMAEIALERDPANVRAMFVAIDNSGVSKLHDITLRYPLMLNRAFAAAGQWPEAASTSVAPAFANARSGQYDADARLKLWAALDAAPGDAGVLRWGTLADLAREASFMLAQRRLEFVATKWSVDASGDLDDWWPVVKDHPAAPILATYAGRGDRAALSQMRIETARETFVPLAYRVREVGMKDAVDYMGWFAKINAQVDQTLDSVGRDAWTNFYAVQREEFSKQSRRLYAAAPQDPTAIAMMIRTDWNAMRDREAALAEIGTQAPHVAWALADRAAYDRDHAKAARYYESAAALAPTWAIYWGLACARRATGDLEGTIKALEAFVQNGQDVGLAAASARSQIAEQLMLTNEAKRALPYSREAATSYAGWALSTHADNLALLGRSNEARGEWEKIIERYGDSNVYPAFIAGVVHPSVAKPEWEQAVRRQAAAANQKVETRMQRAIFQLIDGKLDEAAQTLAGIEGEMRGAYETTALLAAVHLMRDDRAAAKEVIDRLVAISTGDHAAYAHHTTGKLVTAILDGGPAPDPMAKDSVVWHKVDPFVRATDAALIGIACERSGHLEQARAWYGVATRCTGLAPGRVFAAIRLHALSDKTASR